MSRERQFKWFHCHALDDKVYTATFTPTANIEDSSNIISVGTVLYRCGGAIQVPLTRQLITALIPTRANISNHHG